MAKQIIILDTYRGSKGDSAVNALFWYPVAAARQVPIAGAATAFRTATAAEITALQTGAVVEEGFSTQYPPAWTVAQIKAALVTEYNTRVAAFNARPNPNQFYGMFWDGSVWT